MPKCRVSSETHGNFAFIGTSIEGVITIQPRRFGDKRGYFQEAYKRPDFVAAGIKDVFVQENQSRSVRGTLRGLHYQRQFPQSKLVRVQAGEAFDVAVDLRPDSPTFGCWHGELLTSENGHMLYLPHGCAHGILILSDEAVFSYMADDVYHPDDEGAIAWDDSEIDIDWPLESHEVIVSQKDSHNPRLFEVVKEMKASPTTRKRS